MKKIIISLSIILIIISCKNNNSESENNNQPKDSTIVGADKDENGCLASAGYTWSKMNKECVKIFTGIQLLPIEKQKDTSNVVLAAYVLFNEDNSKAEVFLPEEKSIILTRSKNGLPWIFQEYQLIENKGYTLKKSGKDLFYGDGEVGNQNIDDTEEGGEE